MIRFGPAPLGRATGSALDAAYPAQRDPDPDMLLPELDEPAVDDPAWNVPLHPPGTHRHRHHSSEHLGRT